MIVNCAKCAGAEEAHLMVAQGTNHEEVLKIIVILDSLLQALDSGPGTLNQLAAYMAHGGAVPVLRALLNGDNQLIYELLDTMVARYFA